MFNRSVHRAQS